MEILKLKNGKMLGVLIFEIKAIPNYINIAETEQHAQELNVENFENMITEINRYCIPGSSIFEILWCSDKHANGPLTSKLHIYFVIRIIADSIEQLNYRMISVEKSIDSHLRVTGFEFEKTEYKELQSKNMLPEKEANVNALVKAEQCTVHTQSMIPYYYAQPIVHQKVSDFSMISHTLTNFPGSAISFQIIPDVLSPQELSAITEMYSALNQIQSGNIMINANRNYQDQMAQMSKDAYEFLYKNYRQPFYRYNILVFGNNEQCAILTGQVNSLLKGDSSNQFLTINLNGEKISMQEMFMYYPWNLNSNLIKKYRNNQLWKMLQTLPIMQLLYRMPYFLTTKETTTFFKIPIGNKHISGIKEKDIVQNIRDLHEKVIDSKNIQIGKILENSGRELIVGCPEKSWTKHALVVGMPGTGKTTFSVNLLLQMYRKGVPFLAIEPTKTEYRAMIDSIPDLQIFTPGNNGVSPFVINPFIPPKGITIEQFIPSLASAFKAAFSMPSPLDAIFQQAIQEAYIKYGWKDYSTAQDLEVTYFGLHEFILVFKKLISEQKYSAEVKGNLQSGGVLRLRNLIEQNANIYDSTRSVPLEDLLSKPTVFELNAIDNEEQKSVLIALLLINICVYTKHNHIGDGILKNLILIDEAHVLFKAHTSMDEAQGGNSTVRSLENMLAEIRSYGTSVVIADQSPSAVGSNVVKNTDIKVAFRLVDSSDRKIIADTTSMTPIVENLIPKLDVGQAFISYEYLKEPVMVQTPDIREKEKIRLSVSNEEIRHRMTYWSEHSEYLIPFNECGYSSPCSNCSLKLRSDASYYASRFVQDYGVKITDVATLCSYIKAIGKWLKRFEIDENDKMKMTNCVKIRVLRRVLQQKDIMLSTSDYEKIIKLYLNQEE